MGEPLFEDNNSVKARNGQIFNGIADAIDGAAALINGKRTGITLQSDVLERGTMNMLGITSVSPDYPTTVRTTPSVKEPGMMFIDIQGLSDADTKKYVDGLNRKYGPGTAVDIGRWNDKQSGVSFEHSIKIPMDVMRDRIIPDLDRHLETIGNSNPALIRSFQTQSGVAPTFQGPNERAIPSLEIPGNQSFNSGDITPLVAAKGALRDAGASAAVASAEVGVQQGGQRQQGGHGVA